MTKNIGALDKTIRILAAILIIAAYLMGAISGIWGIILLLIALALIITSFLGYCHLYKLLGISTLKK